MLRPSGESFGGAVRLGRGWANGGPDVAAEAGRGAGCGPGGPPHKTRIQFAEPVVAGLAIPYTLLLLFLVLLYSNLPLLFPALDAVRPALLTAVGALGMLTIETMLSGRSFETAWPEGGLLLAFLAATGLSCFTALWPKQAVGAVMDLAKIAVIFFVIVNCVNTERRLRYVMWAMVVGGLIPAVGALRNYAAGQLIEGRAAWLGVFANPNELAYSLVILLPVGAALAAGGRLWMRLAILCCSLVYIPAIFVSFSRGGLMGLGAVLGLYAWRRRNVFVLVVLVLLAIVGLIFGSSYWSRGESFSGLGQDLSVQQRFATYQAALSMFADRPLLGVGLGCSVVAWTLYAPPGPLGKHPLVTHNTFLQCLGETGILGFVPFILFLGAGLYHARKLASRTAAGSLANLGAGLETALWGFVICALSGGYVLGWFSYILVALVASAQRIAEGES